MFVRQQEDLVQEVEAPKKLQFHGSKYDAMGRYIAVIRDYFANVQDRMLSYAEIVCFSALRGSPARMRQYDIAYRRRGDVCVLSTRLFSKYY